jgi:hypothetical protein
MRRATRCFAAAVLTAGTLVGPLAVAASADPGVPAPQASCLAAISDYLAHFDVNTGEPIHGQVGQLLSTDARSQPGAVGEFNRFVAPNHGTIDSCLSD